MREILKKSIEKNLRGEEMRKLFTTATVTAVLVLGLATTAFANHNTASGNNANSNFTNKQSINPALSNFSGVGGLSTGGYEADNNWGDRKWGTLSTDAAKGRVAGGYSGNCKYCHGSQTDGSGYKTRMAGPHGGYTATTKNCTTCHTIHVAYSEKLLPGNTVTAVCNYCHDLTGSPQGPYNMLGITKLDTSKGKVAAHRVVGLKVYEQDASWTPAYKSAMGDWSTLASFVAIPGGDPVTGLNKDLVTATGGTANYKQGELSGNAFTCDSCHTPHGVAGSTVDSYIGDSHVKASVTAVYPSNDVASWSEANPTYTISANLTSRLLKKTPNGVTSSVYETYGTGWCAACHQGRNNDSHVNGAFNHPVNPDGKGYYYLDLMMADAANDGGISAWLAGNMAETAGWQGAIAKRSDRIAAGLPVNGFTAIAGIPRNGGYYTRNYATGVFTAATANTQLYFGEFRNMTQYALTDSDAIKLTGGVATPRTAGQFWPYAQQNGTIGGFDREKGPSCQQCHASARDVESIFQPFEIDPANAKENPHNMNFPHVSKNQDLLIETGDDFCTNCHGLNDLP